MGEVARGLVHAVRDREQRDDQPDADPDAGGGERVRAGRRSRFLSTSPPQVTRRIVPGVPWPTTYAALLRGVNLGARNRVRMPELRALVKDLDCTDVSTYVQSRNVVFRSGRAAGSLAEEIEQGRSNAPSASTFRS